ncbi:MAG: NADH-quinone oxidoreductase subunit L [Elusimicrobia bacterium]|nr:NADH-quinone oxidoreductase subunit L [Elusimicrobiota bacterium]
MATLIAILLFCGAAGKSAQWPLFVWLPDAMEGPTPVSALIHAATMVAAGVYLVARLYFLYVVAPLAMEVVAWVGVLTAFLSATMALVAYDIKRVLAFSTISQLGYMMLGLGVGGYTAGMFHLTTHAFFKALLFLGAGSVIHSLHTNDIRQMGGLSRKMPVTFLTFIVASLAIAGIPPFAGFYSKDEILAEAMHHDLGLFLLAVITAGMTAFYMGRLCFMTFFGDPRDQHKFIHAHESPRTMTVPLMILGLLSAVSGWFFARNHLFESLVHFEKASVSSVGLMTHAQLGVLCSSIAVGAIALAYYLYLVVPAVPEKIKSHLRFLFRVLEKRYGIDDFYLMIISLVDRMSQWLFWFDLHVVDRIFVDGWGKIALFLSAIYGWFDRVIVDGGVDLWGHLSYWAGGKVRLAQSGFVQNYMLLIAIAVSSFALVVFWK